MSDEKDRARIGILISGRGSNMLAIADAVSDGRIPDAHVAVVISDRSDAQGLNFARERGIDAIAIERKGLTREQHENAIIASLHERDVELICLAGFMRLLSPCFVEAFRGRILNIHPSLLPSFPGLDAQQQTLDHGAKFSGCTVHFVDETLDGGPILVQRVVPVEDNDTVASLAARILAEEHKAYPEAIARVLSGEYDIVGRRVVRR